MKRFKSARPQRFLSTHSRIDNHFQLCRHHLSANQHRAARDTAFRTWRDAAGTASAHNPRVTVFGHQHAYWQPDNAVASERCQLGQSAIAIQTDKVRGIY
jgi:hypothetical protein